MIAKIRLLLEFGTYPIFLYDDEGLVIDTANPPEWADDAELTNAFMAVSDLYDTFFINNKNEFSYIGCPDQETKERLITLIEKALAVLEAKNAGKYPIQNDIEYDF